MTNHFEKVAITGNQGQRNLLVGIAKELKARHGSKIYLFCQLPDEIEIYEKLMDDGLFESIDLSPRLMPANLPTGFNEQDVMRRARQFEAQYDTTINDLAVRSRHFGRGYAPGGFFHPRSRLSETSSYAQMVAVYNEALIFWEDVLKGKGITLLINATPESYVIAKKLDIPCRSLLDARYKNYWIWSVDHVESVPLVKENYLRMESAPPPVDLDEPPVDYLKFRAQVLASTKSLDLAKRIFNLCKRSLIWRLTGYYKGKEYYLSSEIRYRYKIWRDMNRLLSWKLATLDDLKSKEFVFYPLHIEPERTLQGSSPEYLYQHASIISISRDLPAGALLAVKEHMPAVGRRPVNFYRQICDLKNVVMMDPREHGQEIVRHAKATVTISSSAGMEAAILGKPVILFGRHALYKFLPHVRHADREESIRGHLDDIFHDRIDLEQAQRDGAVYFQALKAVSFDLRDFNVSDPEGIEDDMPRIAHDMLVQSLAPAALPD